MNVNLFIPPSASPRAMSRGGSRAVGNNLGKSAAVNPEGGQNARFSNINTGKQQIEK